MPVRVTVDISQDEEKIIVEEADRQRRTRKDQLEYIIEKWCDERRRVE